VPHRRRPEHNLHHPVHATLRLGPWLPSLRVPRAGAIILDALAAARRRTRGFRVAHFSIQRDHLHLLVEAGDRDLLLRGLKGLSVRLARRINAALGTRGRVFADRYHLRTLCAPRQVRAALVYVLANHAKPGSGRPDAADPYSSAAWFAGWAQPARPPRPPPFAPARASPVTAPRTWLLATGWRRLGLIALGECPGSRRKALGA
jgi:hypothetical protein